VVDLWNQFLQLVDESNYVGAITVLENINTMIPLFKERKDTAPTKLIEEEKSFVLETNRKADTDATGYMRTMGVVKEKDGTVTVMSGEQLARRLLNETDPNEIKRVGLYIRKSLYHKTISGNLL